MNYNEYYYKIIKITHHNGRCRAECGASSVHYRKSIGLTGKIIQLERGKEFLMDEILGSSGAIIRGFIVQTSIVIAFVHSENMLLIATRNSIYYLHRV